MNIKQICLIIGIVIGLIFVICGLTMYFVAFEPIMLSKVSEVSLNC